MGNEIPRKGMRGHLGDRGAQVAYTEKDLANITVGGMVFNYAGPRQTNSCVRRRIVLADDIDLDKMSIALELTRRRYPQLSLGLEKVGGDVHERHIEAPFKLNRIEPVMVLNKADEGDPAIVKAFEEAYGLFPRVVVSAVSRAGLGELEAAIKGKICCFAGQSAVGKSSLMNALLPELQLPVGELTRKTARGKHPPRHGGLFPPPVG